MGPGQFFLDINSVSPETKRADEAAIVKSGAAYVEAAVMAAIAPYGLKVPMLLGGKPAAELATILNPAGMKMEPVAAIVGQASAIKMCRSVMIKGIEALVVEGFLAARHYGVEDKVIASLDETFPGLNWNRQVGYMLERVLIHGRRRAAEMREAADTVAAAGLEPLMSTATARRQDLARRPSSGAAGAESGAGGRMARQPRSNPEALETRQRQGGGIASLGLGATPGARR